jgi:Flp pilus assembly protein protease CpaA
MNASIRKFLKEEDGVTALEYGLLAAVIAGILIAVGNDQIKGSSKRCSRTSPHWPPRRRARRPERRRARPAGRAAGRMEPGEDRPVTDDGVCDDTAGIVGHRRVPADRDQRSVRPSGAQRLAAAACAITVVVIIAGQFNAPRLPWLPHVAGAALGLLALLPFYALRWMGAGDVKFFAVLGLMLGWQALLPVWLVASLAAGCTPCWCWRRGAGRVVARPPADAGQSHQRAMASASGAARHAGRPPGTTWHSLCRLPGTRRHRLGAGQHLRRCTMNIRSPRLQRGVASIEFALMLMLGLLPLLLFTFSGVMIMAAQQTLATASAEARASLRYGTAGERRTAACVAARTSMQWLLQFSRQNVDCSAGAATPSWCRRRRPAPAWPRPSA